MTKLLLLASLASLASVCACTTDAAAPDPVITVHVEPLLNCQAIHATVHDADGVVVKVSGNCYADGTDLALPVPVNSADLTLVIAVDVEEGENCGNDPWFPDPCIHESTTELSVPGPVTDDVDLGSVLP